MNSLSTHALVFIMYANLMCFTGGTLSLVMYLKQHSVLLFCIFVACLLMDIVINVYSFFWFHDFLGGGNMERPGPEAPIVGTLPGGYTGITF